ncbi:enoyl-CoA hydratase/isomerase family protein [Mycolicibacterium elephantis]|uniref:enoyl-CoA hydratase/isomerase family protein n=1 Tax=Mycolicibacterium elephantis TaxID=81858 RepID=UPI0007EAA7BC|nr:enoyl-CoA hydratase/isomerase family protein [Mycolicibacterium elephantis]OBB16339.1 enoyl-CoA hydratase [Mycolicibacterium elephantis]OBE95283.1 enoyl-CoA hydratase [Mycolicibacterium elephantis]
MTTTEPSSPPTESDERVRLEKDHANHIARITISNPQKKNAMAPEDCELMGRHLDDIAEDDAIKVVLVRGEGGVFTTGVDLNRAYGWYDTPGDSRRPSQRRRLAVDRKGQRMFHDFIGFPKATIVQVESYALGLGLELALAADLAVVSRQAKLGMPAARFLGPVLGNVALFIHRLGPAVARDLMLTGRMATGAEFESAKLFARFVEEEDVAAETEALAALVAKMPADGIAIAKEAYRLVEAGSALGLEETTAYLFHSYGTNLRFEPDEFNFVKERAKSGTSEAFRKRDKHYGTGSAQ